MGQVNKEPDQAKAAQFAGRLFEDVATALRGALSYLGDKLGIFKAMAGAGAVTVQELAQQTGLAPRYLREWLAAMFAAEYLTYDPQSGRYALPAEHALVLADENSPFFMGGMLQMIVPLVSMAPTLAQTFRTGQGVPASQYSADMWQATERGTEPTYRYNLVQTWIPAMPQVKARLAAGGTALDIGCGSGRAAILLASAFPKAHVFGYDIHLESIERARANAAAAGLDEQRVVFAVASANELPHNQFDFVSALDMVHEVADPVDLLTAIRQALTRDGSCLMMEMNVSPHVHENQTAVGRLFYAVSTLYCIAISLAEGGPAIGAMMDEPTARQLAAQAGFGIFNKLQLDDPFSALYELRV